LSKKLKGEGWAVVGKRIPRNGGGDLRKTQGKAKGVGCHMERRSYQLSGKKKKTKRSKGHSWSLPGGGNFDQKGPQFPKRGGGPSLEVGLGFFRGLFLGWEKKTGAKGDEIQDLLPFSQGFKEGGYNGVQSIIIFSRRQG